ncbi:sigma-70 family RNA polymerase sigma factor [uncultured Cyclobacterium sp.]|uniref:RNA polymerase sigma factor n=1 Tax=uncultured Cyclobacterium sp. TaxID=453820 RepID=UPI0030EE793A|tara:strand:+ start:274051 stop:274680 length:630 start_codon:yes stop_codon:yes gene_type:complete
MINSKHTKNAEISTLKHDNSIKQYESRTDMDIWSAFNKGNEAAFNYIYRVYAPSLFQYGGQFSKDEAILQDCIQNIFIELRRKRGHLTEVSNIRAYLYKTMQREVVRMIKREKRTSILSCGLDERIFPIEICHETKLIQQEYEIERKEIIVSAMNQLSPRQRQAILLLYEEGMNFKEIKEVMEFSEVKSARKIIYRALASLKVIIKNKQ